MWCDFSLAALNTLSFLSSAPPVDRQEALLPAMEKVKAKAKLK